ncbi:MAG: signal peptidase II [Atribacterota bacterium]
MGKLAFFLLWFLGVAFDQITKWWAEEVLGNRGIALVPGILQLHLRRNFASAFGLQFLNRSQHIVVTLGVTVFFLFFLFPKGIPRSFMLCLGGSLYLAGAWGNLIDRLWRGYVVDFIEPSFWATFNVADVLIVAGVVSMVWGLLRHEERKDSCL